MFEQKAYTVIREWLSTDQLQNSFDVDITTCVSGDTLTIGVSEIADDDIETLPGMYQMLVDFGFEIETYRPAGFGRHEPPGLLVEASLTPESHLFQV